MGGGWFDGIGDWFGGLGGGAGGYPQVAQLPPSMLVPAQDGGASPVVPDAALAGGMMLDDYGNVVSRGRGGASGVPPLRTSQRPDWEAGPMANPPPFVPPAPPPPPPAAAPVAPAGPPARVTLAPPGPLSPAVQPSPPPSAMDYDPLSGAPIGTLPPGIPAPSQGRLPPPGPAPATAAPPAPARAAPPAPARPPGQAQAAPIQPGPPAADGSQALDATPQAGMPPIGAPREVAMAPGMRQPRYVPEGIHPVTLAMAGAEGTGQNPNSPAAGVGQFLPGTWMSMVRRYGAQAGYDPQLIARAAEDPQAREQVLAWRRDDTEAGRARALQMVEAYRRENVAALRRAGFDDPSPADQYMAHFLGAEGAIRFLRGRASDPNQPVDQVVSPQALAANIYRDRNGNPRWSPFYEFGPNGAQRVRTIGEVYGWADSTIQRHMRNGQGQGQTQVADAAGGAGVTPGMVAGAALAQPGQAPGGQQDDDMRRMLRQALERLNQPDQTPEERQQARRERWGRMAMTIGGNIMAANVPSSTPRSPISEGLGRGVAQVAQGMADDRRQDRADRQASRQRDASLVSTYSAMRPRLVSAGGALYRDDPLSGGTPERVAEAPETWHQPITRRNPDGTDTVIQAGSRGGVRELGDGSVGGRGAGGSGQGTALERNAAAYRRAHPEATDAQALDWARNHGQEAESTLRNRAVNAAQRYRDASNQPLPLEQQTKIAEALTQYYRDGDAAALQERIRQAQPQPAQAQPGVISRMVDSLLGRGTPAGTPAPATGTPPDGLSGAGASRPPPPPPATPGAAQAAPAARRDTARGATPEADQALRRSTQQAEAIRDRYRRGEITRDEATRQLQAIGYQ